MLHILFFCMSRRYHVAEESLQKGNPANGFTKSARQISVPQIRMMCWIGTDSLTVGMTPIRCPSSCVPCLQVRTLIGRYAGQLTDEHFVTLLNDTADMVQRETNEI